MHLACVHVHVHACMWLAKGGKITGEDMMECMGNNVRKRKRKRKEKEKKQTDAGGGRCSSGGRNGSRWLGNMQVHFQGFLYILEREGGCSFGRR